AHPSQNQRPPAAVRLQIEEGDLVEIDGHAVGLAWLWAGGPSPLAERARGSAQAGAVSSGGLVRWPAGLHWNIGRCRAAGCERNHDMTHDMA
ncbi:MAG: hypothetical protein JW940_08380, partial [Polyangiaceae bacterium]|nr:hypothetical protein [Polyangiaceae bacterium]